VSLGANRLLTFLRLLPPVQPARILIEEGKIRRRLRRSRRCILLPLSGYGLAERLEANAKKLVSDLPPGTRIITTIWAPPGSRNQFYRPLSRARLHRALLQLCEL